MVIRCRPMPIRPPNCHDVRDYQRRFSWPGSCRRAALLCLPLDLAKVSAVNIDIFYGSCRRPDAQLILLE